MHNAIMQVETLYILYWFHFENILCICIKFESHFFAKYIFWSILHLIQKFNKPISTPARLDQLVERDQEYIKHVSLTRRVGK